MFASGERLRPEARAQFLEGGRFAEGQADFDTFDQDPDVLIVDQVVGIDDRLVVRIGRAQADVSGGFGTQQHGNDGPRVPVRDGREIIFPNKVGDAVSSADLGASVSRRSSGYEMEFNVGLYLLFEAFHVYNIPYLLLD